MNTTNKSVATWVAANQTLQNEYGQPIRSREERGTYQYLTARSCSKQQNKEWMTIFIDTKQINKQTSKAAFCLLVISKAPETHKDSIKWSWHVFQTFPPTDQMTRGIMESAGNMIVTQHLSIFPDMMDFVHLKREEWKNMRNYGGSRNAATVNVIWSTQITAGMFGEFRLVLQ